MIISFSKKIERLESDIQKTRDKITELRQRLKEQETALQGERNAEVLNMVHGSGLSLEDLAELLGMGQPAPSKPQNQDIVVEDGGTAENEYLGDSE